MNTKRKGYFTEVLTDCIATGTIPIFYGDPEIGKYSFTYYYRKYISEGKYVAKVSALELWQLICKLTSETGIPYKCFKDAANRKSNQKI